MLQFIHPFRARNIVAIYNSTMSMLPHVNSVCKSAFYHLFNISRIRKFLSSKTTEVLVHAFVSSKLDYCNSLLYNVPKYVMKQLQSVQNAAARLITCSRKYDITPVLSDLHLLPVNERILLLTFKALHQQAPTYIQDFVTVSLFTDHLAHLIKSWNSSLFLFHFLHAVHFISRK